MTGLVTVPVPYMTVVEALAPSDQSKAEYEDEYYDDHQELYTRSVQMISNILGDF